MIRWRYFAALPLPAMLFDLVTFPEAMMYLIIITILFYFIKLSQHAKAN